MGFLKSKTTLFLMIACAVMLVLGVAGMRANRSSQTTAPTQRVTATEKSPAPRGVANILERDQATREADQEVAGDMAH